MSKERISRENDEMKEGKETIKSDVPDNKFQNTQQVSDTMDANDVKGSTSSFTPKTIEGKGAEVKIEKVSDLLAGSASGSGMGISAGGRSVSGTVGGILGANNSTIHAGKARGDSRVERKLDRSATKLNFTPSENFFLKLDESKPLAEAKDKDQGYRGTYRNQTARSQKIMGAVPGDAMFQRSVDFIEKDYLYFSEGQMVLPTGDNVRYFPTRTIDMDAAELYGNLEYTRDRNYKFGNFLHRGFHFGFDDENRKVNYFYADVEDISTIVSQDDANVASAHRLIKLNSTELDRSVMDTKAGDEKGEVWSPIPRAIDQPDETVALLSTIEAEVGAYVHMAYSKASTCMAFQLNRGPKDGLDEVTPGIDMIVGYRYSLVDSTHIRDEFTSIGDTLSIDNYLAGDSSLMIEAYDSKNKYKSKADLLLQPRGFRMHLQTADNNMNPLHVPTEYAQFYSANEVFSTIEHDYDPELPICMTDKSNLVLPNDLNDMCAFANYGEEFILDFAGGTAHELRSKKKILFHLGAIKAINRTFRLAYKVEDVSGDALVLEINRDSDGNYKINIKDEYISGATHQIFHVKVYYDDESLPTGYSAMTFALGPNDISDRTTEDAYVYFEVPIVGEVQVTSANVTYNKSNHYRVNCGPFSYGYADLRNNYIVEVKHPLIEGLINYLDDSVGAKMYELLGHKHLYIPMIFSTRSMTLAQLVICASTPWIERVRKNTMKDVIYYEDNIHEYPFSRLSSMKDVPLKRYVNFDYTDYDHPLGTKIMMPALEIKWTMPEFFWNISDNHIVLPWYFNEEDLDSDGVVKFDAANMSMPSIRSGVRLGLLDNFYSMEEKDIRLSLDRMTKSFLRNDRVNIYAYKYGRTMDGQPVFVFNDSDEDIRISIHDVLSCPRELGLGMECPLGVLTPDPDIDELECFDDDGTRTSFRIYAYCNPEAEIHPQILSRESVNINRAANYVQKYFILFANNADADTSIGGLVFGLRDGDQAYTPLAELGTGLQAVFEDVDVITFQQALNTRLQYLPFIISPFDSMGNEDRCNDIYDFGYIFGLCGFRASDYTESVYNREKQVINQGPLFVQDPWILDSPLMKEGSTTTGLVTSKGYELK